MTTQIGQIAAGADVERLATSAIETGEKLLWIGKPGPSAPRAGLDPWTVSAGVPLFVAFELVLVAAGIGGDVRPSLGQTVPSVPAIVFFAGLGVGMILWGRRHATGPRPRGYAITDRRALALGAEPAVRTDAGPLPALSGVLVCEGVDGSGDLALVWRSGAAADAGRPRPVIARVDRREMAAVLSLLGPKPDATVFAGIPQVRAIARLALDAFDRLAA